MKISTALQIKATPVKSKTKKVLCDLTNVPTSVPTNSNSSGKNKQSLESVTSEKNTKENFRKDWNKSSPFTEEEERTSEQVQWKATVFPNVNWKNTSGTVKITSEGIFFRPHDETKEASSTTITDKTRRLWWEKVKFHETKIIAQERQESKYWLRLVLKKADNASLPSLVLSSSERTLNEMSNEISRQLNLNKSVNSSTPSHSSSYYPLVRLVINEGDNATRAGSLFLTSESLIFEPITHRPMPAIKIAWNKIQKHQLNCRSTKALLNVICHSSPANPIVFQVPTQQKLKRLNQDIQQRLRENGTLKQEKEGSVNCKGSTGMKQNCTSLLKSTQVALVSPRERTVKKVTFQLPRNETARVMDFTSNKRKALSTPRQVYRLKNQTATKRNRLLNSKIRNFLMASFCLSIVALSVIVVTTTVDVGFGRSKFSYPFHTYWNTKYSNADDADHGDTALFKELYNELQDGMEMGKFSTTIKGSKAVVDRYTISKAPHVTETGHLLCQTIQEGMANWMNIVDRS